MKIFKKNLGNFTKINQFLSDILQVNVKGQSFKKYIRQIVNLAKSGDKDHAILILEALINTFSCQSQTEFFLLNGGTQSGIGVTGTNAFPKSGYCFFGWIRIERQDQNTTPDENKSICIYKFHAAKEGEIEFGINDSTLFYIVIVWNIFFRQQITKREGQNSKQIFLKNCFKKTLGIL